MRFADNQIPQFRFRKRFDDRKYIIHLIKGIIISIPTIGYDWIQRREHWVDQVLRIPSALRQVTAQYIKSNVRFPRWRVLYLIVHSHTQSGEILGSHASRRYCGMRLNIQHTATRSQQQATDKYIYNLFHHCEHLWLETKVYSEIDRTGRRHSVKIDSEVLRIHILTHLRIPTGVLGKQQ